MPSAICNMPAPGSAQSQRSRRTAAQSPPRDARSTFHQRRPYGAICIMLVRAAGKVQSASQRLTWGPPGGEGEGHEPRGTVVHLKSIREEAVISGPAQTVVSCGVRHTRDYSFLFGRVFLRSNMCRRRRGGILRWTLASVVAGSYRRTENL